MRSLKEVFMFAIVQVGSAQFKISEGETIFPNRIKDKVGDSVTLDKVLMVTDKKKVSVGKPYLSNVTVKAKVVEHTLGPKSTAFKYRRRKESATKKGHRQKITALNITKITAK